MADTGVPHYADANPPPSGTVVPVGYRLATVQEVDSGSGVTYNSGINSWVVADKPATTNTSTATGSTNTGTSSTTNTDSQGTLPTVTVTAKRLKPAVVLENPLDPYASYTYSWSLWALSPEDYNTLSMMQSVGEAQAWNPTKGKSFVIAEDAGLYPDQRLVSSAGLNYHMQSVEFTTSAGLNNKSWHTNLISGNFTIREPYGVTFIDTLVYSAFAVAHSGSSETQTNYLDRPFMLQLDFHGYDDAGSPIPGTVTNLLRKRFPIRIINMKVEVTAGGSQYRCQFAPLNHWGLYEEYVNVPKAMVVAGSTVKEFFNNLAAEMQKFWQAQVKQGAAIYPDGINFDIDNKIGESKIVLPNATTLNNANPDGITLDLTKRAFNIPEGTKITDLINRVICLSEYLATQLESHGGLTSPHNKPFNSFKTMVGLQYGSGNQGSAGYTAFDAVKNSYPKIINYRIHQFTTFSANHPALDQGPNSQPYTCKSYEYIYTGHNKNIIDLKLNFDTTYYTAVLNYRDKYPADQITSDTDVEEQTPPPGTVGKYNVGPTLLSAIYPSLKNVLTISPIRYNGIVNNQNLTTWGSVLSSPKWQQNADVQNSLYTASSGDMISCDLTIRGDPHLIRQDDWLVSPSPNSGSDYGFNKSQSEFASKFGFLPLEIGDLIVALTINTPIDQDIDINGRGLSYWMGGSYTPTTSLFSGQYRIIQIKNHFENGSFTQVLKLVRQINNDFASALASLQSLRGESVSTSVNQQSQSTPANSSTQQTVPVNNQRTP